MARHNSIEDGFRKNLEGLVACMKEDRFLPARTWDPEKVREFAIERIESIITDPMTYRLWNIILNVSVNVGDTE